MPQTYHYELIFSGREAEFQQKITNPSVTPWIVVIAEILQYIEAGVLRNLFVPSCGVESSTKKAISDGVLLNAQSCTFHPVTLLLSCVPPLLLVTQKFNPFPKSLLYTQSGNTWSLQGGLYLVSPSARLPSINHG